jgi:hypothetical protein
MLVVGRYQPIEALMTYSTLCHWTTTKLIAIHQEELHKQNWLLGQARMPCLITILYHRLKIRVFILIGHALSSGSTYNSTNSDQGTLQYVTQKAGYCESVFHINNEAIKCNFAVDLRNDNIQDWY